MVCRTEIYGAQVLTRTHFTMFFAKKSYFHIDRAFPILLNKFMIHEHKAKVQYRYNIYKLNNLGEMFKSEERKNATQTSYEATLVTI